MHVWVLRHQPLRLPLLKPSLYGSGQAISSSSPSGAAWRARIAGRVLAVWRACGLTALCSVPAPRCVVQVGWKHKDAVAYLEEKRKAKSQKFYLAKKKLVLLRKQAAAKA